MKDDNPLDLPPVADAPVGTSTGIAAIALSLAMKYHDINTVQDGALYQQYKLEGRNLVPLQLDMVFETAIRMERHLVTANERIAGIVVEALESGLAADLADDPSLDEYPGEEEAHSADE